MTDPISACITSICTWHYMAESISACITSIFPWLYIAKSIFVCIISIFPMTVYDWVYFCLHHIPLPITNVAENVVLSTSVCIIFHFHVALWLMLLIYVPSLHNIVIVNLAVCIMSLSHDTSIGCTSITIYLNN